VVESVAVRVEEDQVLLVTLLLLPVVMGVLWV
jgi:hypothetical protein